MKIRKIKGRDLPNPMATDLIDDKIYNVLEIEKKMKWYRVVDESGEDYLYPPQLFEIAEDGMNKIIKDCIQRINYLYNFLDDAPQENDVADGINTANQFVNGGIGEHIANLVIINEGIKGVYTTANAVSDCLKEVNAFISELETLESKFGNDAKGNALKRTTRIFISKLVEIRSNLNIYLFDEKYSNY